MSTLQGDEDAIWKTINSNVVLEPDSLQAFLKGQSAFVGPLNLALSRGIVSRNEIKGGAWPDVEIDENMVTRAKLVLEKASTILRGFLFQKDYNFFTTNGVPVTIGKSKQPLQVLPRNIRRLADTDQLVRVMSATELHSGLMIKEADTGLDWSHNVIMFPPRLMPFLWPNGSEEYPLPLVTLANRSLDIALSREATKIMLDCANIALRNQTPQPQANMPLIFNSTAATAALVDAANGFGK